MQNSKNILVSNGEFYLPAIDGSLNKKLKFGESGYYPIQDFINGKAIIHFFFLNRVYNCDFRLAYWRLPSNCLVVSDPPYNQGYKYNSYSDNLPEAVYQDLLKAAFYKRKSVIIHYPEESINTLPNITGVRCEEVVTWAYNSNTAKQSRSITFWDCKPDFKLVGQPYKNPNDKRIQKLIKQGKKARLYDYWTDIQQVKNVTKKKTGNIHPCPIPEELIERILLITTKVGDIVVDPFAGCGTVLKVAKRLGRRYIGFEIDPTYYKYMKSIGL